MLPHQLSCPIGGLLLSVLMLKDANPNHYPVPGVECVVSHESRQFTNDGHKVLLGHLGHPLRVGNTVTYPTKYKRPRATLWRPALWRLQATYNSDVGLARGHTIPRSPLAQRTRAVPELLRMPWVVSGLEGHY